MIPIGCLQTPRFCWQGILDMKWACGLLEDEVAPDPETAMEVRDNLLELYAWNLYFILYRYASFGNMQFKAPKAPPPPSAAIPHHFL